MAWRGAGRAVRSSSDRVASGARRAGRIARTGFAFAFFGASALALGAVVIPIGEALALRRGSEAGRARDARERRAQYAIHLGYRLFVRVLLGLRLVRLRVLGAERLGEGGPKLVAANHPSLIDAPLLVAHMPQADCTVSSAWARSPVLRRCVDAAGYLPSADGLRLVREARRRLRSGRSIVMFPEGTRSPAAGLGPFYRGAAHVSLASGEPILPVCIRFEPRALVRGQRWWEVPPETPRVTVEVLEPLAPEGVLEGGESPGVAAHKVTAALRERIEKRLGGGR